MARRTGRIGQRVAVDIAGRHGHARRRVFNCAHRLRRGHHRRVVDRRDCQHERVGGREAAVRRGHSEVDVAVEVERRGARERPGRSRERQPARQRRAIAEPGAVGQRVAIDVTERAGGNLIAPRRIFRARLISDGNRHNRRVVDRRHRQHERVGGREGAVGSGHGQVDVAVEVDRRGARERPGRSRERQPTRQRRAAGQRRAVGQRIAVRVAERGRRNLIAPRCIFSARLIRDGNRHHGHGDRDGKRRRGGAHIAGRIGCPGGDRMDTDSERNIQTEHASAICRDRTDWGRAIKQLNPCIRLGRTGNCQP